MCAPLVVSRCSCASLRWLAELFDLDVDAHSTAVDWSRLLEVVAGRLDADVEPEFSAEFPWPLRHLSVLGGRGRAVASLAPSGCGASLLRGLQALSSRWSFAAQSLFALGLCVSSSGDLWVEYARTPYTDLLATVLHLFR